MTEKRTALYNAHVSLDAKMTAFGGFLLPVHYEGIIAEHQATRRRAAIFDTCHMGEFHIHGGRAVSDLENLLSCSVANLAVGQCRYGFLCNEDGGVVDDQILYRLGDDAFFMVVNGGTQDGDYDWVAGHLSPETRIENFSAETAKVDLQGPCAPRIMQRLSQEPIDKLRFFHFRHVRYRGKRILISRTGYTGEIGFEVYSDSTTCRSFWDDCLSEKAVPAGLGARDTLRMEMGFPLYGNELSADRNAAESGLFRAIADKAFIGSGVVHDVSLRKERLVALVLEARRAARAHDSIFDPGGELVGTVTSGGFAPSLGNSIAMGYIRISSSQPGTRLVIRTARTDLNAVVGETPLYRDATGRMALKRFLD